MRRLTTQGGRDAAAAAAQARLAVVLNAAEERGWVGCGDLVDRKLRLSNPFKMLPDEQRFALSYVIDPDTGCWPWVGSRKTAGYGQIRFRRRQSNAHRVSWLIHVGPLADDLDIDHLCLNKSCVNPQHLEPVPPGENTRRWAASIVTCPAGHERSYRQHDCRECRKPAGRRKAARETVGRIARDGTEKVKLSDSDIAAMKAKRSAGVRVKDIAAAYGVTPKYASAVIAGSRRRRHRYTGPTKGALLLVTERAGPGCEFAACAVAAEHTHHRRPRRLGGSRDPKTNLPSNLVRLCADHHEWVESNRLEASELGLLLNAQQDPVAVPVRLARGLVYLLDDGTVRPAFIHLYCCTETAMCGYHGPDEPPNAERLPRCPTCVERATAPCDSPTCPDRKAG